MPTNQATSPIRNTSMDMNFSSWLPDRQGPDRQGPEPSRGPPERVLDAVCLDPVYLDPNYLLSVTLFNLLSPRNVFKIPRIPFVDPGVIDFIFVWTHVSAVVLARLTCT